MYNDSICKLTSSDSFFRDSANVSVKKDYQHKNNQVFGTCSVKKAITINLFART